jgi:hypothetical protein
MKKTDHSDKERIDFLNRGDWVRSVRWFARGFGEYDDLRAAVDAAIELEREFPEVKRKRNA